MYSVTDEEWYSQIMWIHMMKWGHKLKITQLFVYFWGYFVIHSSHGNNDVFTWGNQIFPGEFGKENTWSAGLECWEGIVIIVAPEMFTVGLI